MSKLRIKHAGKTLKLAMPKIEDIIKQRKSLEIERF